MTYKEFITCLASEAMKLFAWELELIPDPCVRKYRLRGISPEGQRFDPMTAVCLVQKGEYFPEKDVYHAAQYLGLRQATFSRIIRASDGDFNKRSKTLHDLLKVTVFKTT